MADEVKSNKVQKKHCRQCGAHLDTGGHFCGSCGSRVDSSASQPQLSWARAGIVFAGVVAASAIAFWFAEDASRPPQRAVPGAPSSPAGEKSALPANHPPLELPAEAVKLLEELTDAANASPDSIDAWQRLGRARYRAALVDRRYLAGAKQALEKVMTLDPANQEGLKTLGNLAYDTQDFAGAQIYFSRYLELEPTDPNVKTDLGSVFLFQGDRDGAKKLYREVIAANPDFLQAHLNLGVALHADGDHDAAEASLAAALERARTPEQKAQVERIIALARQRSAQSPTADEQESPSTNASGPFQTEVDELLLEHSIVGPKIASISWTGNNAATVAVRDFPMNSMPEFARNKFKSGVNKALSELAARHGASETLHIDLVDAENGEKMDTLDGKESAGAFDESEKN